MAKLWRTPAPVPNVRKKGEAAGHYFPSQVGRDQWSLNYYASLSPTPFNQYSLASIDWEVIWNGSEPVTDYTSPPPSPLNRSCKARKELKEKLHLLMLQLVARSALGTAQPCTAPYFEQIVKSQSSRKSQNWNVSRKTYLDNLLSLHAVEKSITLLLIKARVNS